MAVGCHCDCLACIVVLAAVLVVVRHAQIGGRRLGSSRQGSDTRPSSLRHSIQDDVVRPDARCASWRCPASTRPDRDRRRGRRHPAHTGGPDDGRRDRADAPPFPSHPDLRAIEVVYRYRLDDVDQSSRLPRSALTVALRAEGETIGSLAAISRSRGQRSPDATEDALERLARRAGPAICERDPLHRGARARRARLAHRPAQPAALLRVPRARDRRAPGATSAPSR